jgi:hypothetical protein
MNQSPREVLIAARKLIEKPENWTQRKFRHGDAYCMSGALLAIDGHSIMSSAVYAALKQAVPSSFHCLAEWNDAPERTHAEVLAAFDRAIAMTSAEPATPAAAT